MRLIAVPLIVLATLFLTAMVVIPIWIALMFALWHFLMPWLVVGLVIWAAFAITGGRHQRRSPQHYYQPASLARRPDSIHTSPRPQPRPQPQPALPPRPRAELPIDVQVKTEQIRRKVEVLLGYASRFPPFSSDLYVVRQTANDYLPRTIDAYLALPPGQGELSVDASGKTALQELKEQLDLLDSKLDEIAEDLQRQNLDRLLANRRFLEDRFGRTSA
jgi:hypothetical protein